MPVEIRCPQCSARLQIKSLRLRKLVRCPGCQTRFDPAQKSQPAEADEFKIADLPERHIPVPIPAEQPAEDTLETQANRERRRRAPWTMWILLLTLVPLLVLGISPGADWDSQVNATLTAQPDLFDTIEPNTPRAELLSHVPGGKLLGAHLSYRSSQQWNYGLASIAGFVPIVLLLFRARWQQLPQLLIAVVFTALAGLLLLGGVRWLADLAHERWTDVGNVFWMFFYIVRFAAQSYRGVMDSEVGLVSAWFAFTVGVSLCEAMLTITPVYAALKTRDDVDWHAAMLWGLASGVGMGVAEAIVYAADFDNGTAEMHVYLVRFMSCVALQAVWCGAGGILLWAAQGVFDESLVFYEWAFAVGRILLMPIVLHGLFDTLLRRGFVGGALLVSLLSFVVLFGLVHYTAGQSGDG